MIEYQEKTVEYREKYVKVVYHPDGSCEEIPVEKWDREIVFESQILDNVHGFISYTAAEKKIMETQLFRRLQSIKQLSVVNWVFPGSEHTRYIHSLGVMHIADKMAISMKLSNRERRILRMAGLLHDIGHYPLSHVGEAPYRKAASAAQMQAPNAATFCKAVNTAVVKEIERFSFRKETHLMEASVGFHHEAVGAEIVKNNPEIKKIVEDELGEGAAEIIANIITGNVDVEHSDKMKRTDPLWVQIMHSELDADGIDYIMRDSASAGTNFGACEIDQLIRCLTVGKLEDGTRIMCIRPKGIPAADQYLVNKFFHYSQVVFNRHIVICEMMAKTVISWMRYHNRIFPGPDKMREWMNKGGPDEYLAFNDNMFWSALSELQNDPAAPEHIQLFCRYLLRHDEPVVAKRDEIRIVSHLDRDYEIGTNDEDKRSGAERIRMRLKESDTCNKPASQYDWLTALETRSMSKQLPEVKFLELIEKKFYADTQGNAYGADQYSLREEMDKLNRLRKMEFICVKEHSVEGKPDVIRVLCDDERSLMQDMYDKTIAILRSYEYPKNKAKA